MVRLNFIFYGDGMDKKQYLIKVLTLLEPVRNLAEWLKILVEEWNLEDDVLDVLINAVQWAVNTASSEVAKGKLQKWLEMLERMKQMESESEVQDEKDLAELDRMLDNF